MRAPIFRVRDPLAEAGVVQVLEPAVRCCIRNAPQGRQIGPRHGPCRGQLAKRIPASFGPIGVAGECFAKARISLVDGGRVKTSQAFAHLHNLVRLAHSIRRGPVLPAEIQ